MEKSYKKLRIKDQDEATLADRYRNIMKRKNARQKNLYHLQAKAKKQAQESKKIQLLDQIFLEMKEKGLLVHDDVAVLHYIKSQTFGKAYISKHFLNQYRQNLS